MEWQVIVALVVMLPVILLPAAFVWYLNVGGMVTALKEARKRQPAREQEGEKVVAEHQAVK